MVYIDQKDFNEDMGRYIAGIRNKERKPLDFFSFGMLKDKKKRAEPVPEQAKESEVLVEPEEPSFFQRMFKRKMISEEDIEESEELKPEEMKELEHVEDEIEEVEKEEEELQEEREGLIKTFMKKLRFFEKKHKEPGEEEMVEEIGDAISVKMDDDVREVLKVMHKWLERLPPHEIKQFKLSEDFVKYKDILKKYGLIK